MLSRQLQACLFFLRKDFDQKNIKQAKTKTKIGEQKATKATIFRAQKLHKKEKKYLFCIFFHLKSLLKKN